MRIELAETEKGDVEAAAGIEVELRRRVDHGAGVAREAEDGARQQFAAIDAMLDGLDIAARPHIGGDQRRHRVRDAKAEIDDHAITEFVRGAARDRLTFVERGRRRFVRRQAPQPRHGGVEGDVVGHGLVRRDDDGVDPGAGNGDGMGGQGARLHALAHFDDHLAAGSVRRQRAGLSVVIGAFLGEADIALVVGIGAAQQRDMHGEALVEQKFLAADGHDVNQRVLRAGVHPAALDARIDEGAEPDARNETGPPGADLAIELHHHAARQHIGLDGVGARHVLHARRPDPVAADHLAHEALMREAVNAARLAVADAERMDEREIARRAARQKALLDGGEQRARLQQPAAAAHQRNRVAVADQRRGGFRRDELRARHVRLRCRKATRRGAGPSARG